jgi:DNA-binding NtrC family response regulator
MDDASPRVLIVDDEKDICDLVSHLLEENGIATSVACDGGSALRQLRRSSPDLLILDLRLPDMDGMEVLRRALELDDELPVVMLTAQGGVRDAAQAIREHAFDFLPKPYRHGELLRVVRLGLEKRRFLRDSHRISIQTTPRDELFSIMGRSEAVAKLVTDVNKVAGCSFNVVIVGETGSGKEVVARAIHNGGARAGKPFVAIDCGAIPEMLIESELFGHEKGAFTGAVGSSSGRFEQADGGTLFLDEILNMPLPAQAKVLRSLQEKCVCRVGGARQIKVDVRVLAACSRNLEQAVAEGLFRADLFYRLSEFALHVPALRERPEDIPYLAERFLRTTNAELG